MTFCCCSLSLSLLYRLVTFCCCSHSPVLFIGVSFCPLSLAFLAFCSCSLCCIVYKSLLSFPCTVYWRFFLPSFSCSFWRFVVALSLSLSLPLVSFTQFLLLLSFSCTVYCYFKERALTYAEHKILYIINIIIMTPHPPPPVPGF